MQLSLSVEDTNKIRQQLGLKLIPIALKSNAVVDSLRSRALAITSSKSSKEAAWDPQQNDIPPKEPQRDPQPEPQSENTVSWLSRMRARAKEMREVPDSGPDPKPPSKSPGEGEALVDTSVETPVEAVQSLVDQKPIAINTNLVQPNKRPAESLPTDESRRAVFKPKKIKLHASQRQPSNREKFLHLKEENNERDEDAEFEKFLLLSRQRHSQNSASEKPTVGSGPQKASRRISHIFSRSKAEFKNRFINHGSETKSMPSELHEATSDNPTSQDDDLATSLEMEPEEQKNHVKQPSLGLAETIRRLKSKTPAKPESASKDWAKKLVDAQKLREQELQSLTKKYANLPVHEREEALKIHKEQLMHERARDAHKFSESYRPDINLDNRDAKGNLITSQQAFRELSKTFHGST